MGIVRTLWRKRQLNDEDKAGGFHLRQRFARHTATRRRWSKPRSIEVDLQVFSGEDERFWWQARSCSEWCHCSSVKRPITFREDPLTLGSGSSLTMQLPSSLLCRQGLWKDLRPAVFSLSNIFCVHWRKSGTTARKFTLESAGKNHQPVGAVWSGALLPLEWKHEVKDCEPVVSDG